MAVDETNKPVSGSEPPPAAPIAKARSTTLKLKPVIRKPVVGVAGAAKPAIGPGLKLPAPAPAAAPAASAPAAPAADASASPSAASGNALEQLKSVTQKLKGVTQEIPQQAILRKTGIIADQDLSDAQKQASKSRTARISLSDALGVAPVQNEAAPIKTIRIKRPDSIAKGPATETDAAPAEGEETETAATAAGDSSTSITQRKTLKISRPGAVRPAGKFGIKKPGAAPAAAPAAPASDGAPAAAEGEVADIPDIADMPTVTGPKFAPASAQAGTIPDVPKGVAILGLLVQIAACVAVGFLGYMLYQDAQMPLFCGGCGWGQ